MPFDFLENRRARASIKWKRYPEDVIPMWVADMDFPAPKCIQDALQEAVEHGIYGYSLPRKELIQTIVSRLENLYQWKVRANAIVWLPGLVPALNICARAYVNENQNIACSTPIYPPFLEAPEFAEKKLITVPLALNKERYEMDFENLKKSMNKNTGLYYLCNPHNPVGRAYSKDELIKLASLCEKKNAVICSDEIHCDLLLDESAQHTPIASLSEDIANRTVTLMSPSKTWNLPGLGFAFAIIPNFKLRKKFLRNMKGIVPYPTQMGLIAAEAAYKNGENWRQELIVHLQKNQVLIREFISSKMPQVSYIPGEATYLAWLDVRNLGIAKPYEYFLKHGVALSDGKDFKGEGFLRLNFATTEAILKQGLERLYSAYSQLSG